MASRKTERVFVVSILGGGKFEFPTPIPLEKRLKDVLEDEVDEKYYLSDRTIKSMIGHCERKQAEGCGFKFDPKDGGNKPSDNNGIRRTSN